MEILSPETDAAKIAPLKALIDLVESKVDYSVLPQFRITTQEQAVEVATAMLSDKTQRDYIFQSLDPFSKFAFRVHRFISGKINKFVEPYDKRNAVRDQALVDWHDEQDRIAREEEARLKKLAQDEDVDRRIADAAVLTERAQVENKPELAARAEQILNEPTREVSVTSSRRPASTIKTSAGSVNLGKKSYEIEVTDDTALKLAVVRPYIYREIAQWVRTQYKTPQGTKFAEALEKAAGEKPQIPLNVLDCNEGKIKANAKATDGAINWPGVAVSEARGTSSRRR